MKLIKYLLLMISFTLITCMAMAQNNKPDAKRYIKVPAGYLMVLRQGDNVLASIEQLAVTEQLPSASFTGMGFVNATFGFFNFDKKAYEPKTFTGVELASMNGSIAWQAGKVSLHTHGVVTDKEFKSYGGHMLEAVVGTGSVEIMVIVHDKPLDRIMEQPLGANVLSLDHKL